MSGAALYLFDDDRARRWLPFALTRPVGELLHGCLLQRERAERLTGLECAGHLAGETLTGFHEEGAPPVVAPDEVPDDRPRLLLSSRAVAAGWADGDAPRLSEVGDVTRLTVGGEPAGWIVPAGAPLPGPDALSDPAAAPHDGPEAALDGHLLGWPWDLIAGNADRLKADIDALHRTGDSFLLTDVHVLGDHPVSLGEGAVVEPGVVLDVRSGPIRLEAGARVRGPARVTGPTWIGRDSVVLGGSVEHASIGPVCKVRGEVEASVVLGWSNKAHDGYLGHACLGRWVNLGAMTTNSDLKNSYSPVRVPLGPDEEIDTGLLKVGALLGDHVKMGIGMLLTTGAVVGAGSNVFGGGVAPKWVPPFSWVEGDRVTAYRLEKLLEVAEAAMARREVELDDGTRALLRRAYETTRGPRT